jgi:ATP/maltotriose-dependent transcriptional regulator MalT
VRPPTGQSPHRGETTRASHASTSHRGSQHSEKTAAHALDIDGLVRAGRISDAISLSHGSLFLGDQSPEATARIRLTLSSLLFMSGRVDESSAQAIAILVEPEVSNNVRAGAKLAQLRAMVMTGDRDAARLGAESILAGAEWAGADLALTGAFETLGYLAWDEGRATEALRWMHASIQRADQGPSEVRRSNPRLHMAAMLTAFGEFELSAEMLSDVEERLVASQYNEWLSAVSAMRTRLLFARGENDRAECEAKAALALSERLGTPLFASMALSVLAELALRRGDLASAARLLEDVRAVPPPVGVLGWASHMWAEIHLREAQVGASRALELLSGCLSDHVATNCLLLEDTAGAAWWVRSALAVGDRDTAERIVADVAAIARSNPELPTLTAADAHARGILERRPDLLRDAIARHRSPWARASAMEDLAMTLSLNDRAASLMEIDRSLAIYSQIGSVRDASRVRRRRRQKSERPVSGWASLTSPEQRVALVVAEGLTNAQVGTRLFLSRHTVDFHLRQVFRKLGITSRVELVRLVITEARAD